MAKGIVIYYSRSGNTRQMAQLIAESMNQAGLRTDCKSVSEVRAEELLDCDAIVIGSPTYYGQMAAPLKQLIDDMVKWHGRFDGKVGAAFSSSANVAGGNETTILGIIEAMLINGMIIQGDHQGDHYGPVSINEPDARVIEQCRRRGRRIAKLALNLFS